ncbi:MAG TPA: hypothetical protein VK481_00860 [Gemmatimonadaceae bacterium]|nr:hypothetical protein [Gemmatimonadaceae bacterium]
MLALVMGLFFIGSGRTYAEHFIFSIQVYAFLLCYLAAAAFLGLLPLMMVLRAIGPAADPIVRTLKTELAIDTVLLVGMTIYIYFGLRRAYEASRVRAAFGGVVLAAASGFLIALYNNALFYITFRTT